MKYIRPIDPHVHLRCAELRDYAEYDIAAVKLAAVCAMPNTDPPLIDETSISNYNLKNNQFCNIGLTCDLEQVGRAVGLTNAVKIFYSGNMGILDAKVQHEIWKKLSGVVMGHFEDEKYFKDKFYVGTPTTHSHRQNLYSERVQVERQIKNAVDVGFSGVFWVCHISNPETVHFLNSLDVKFDIIKEMTWHHMFLNTLDYRIHGNCVKMNPPLREVAVQEALLNLVLRGDIDVIGSDHAPHTLESKMGDVPPSGIPALPFWPKGIEKLRNLEKSLDVDAMTFYTANRVLGLGLVTETVDVEYDVRLWDKYGWNPFLSVL